MSSVHPGQWGSGGRAVARRSNEGDTGIMGAILSDDARSSKQLFRSACPALNGSRRHTRYLPMPAIQFIQIVTGGVEPSVSTDARNFCPFAEGA